MSSDPPPPAVDPPSALPRGTRLGEFELLQVLGVGGFGIVYLAFDHALHREVAVKEYMPVSLAGRTETLHVSLRSQSDADTFSLGLKSFVNEARLLARFDHPSLVKVHRFWEANGTAYMAMPVYRGRTLKEVRAAMSTPPDEAGLRAMLIPLLGAIEKLHSEGVFHRDIAPDNIQIEADGRPVLLDFGAARRVITDKSQALTAILKPAYAPIEQYGEAGSVRQGPWTDLYALGATLHFMLIGRPPPPATARAMHDDLQPLAGQALAGCSAAFLHTIDWMLAPRPADRPQSVAALLEVLDGRVAPPTRRAVPPAAPVEWERTLVVEPAPPGSPAAVGRSASPVDDGTVVVPIRQAAASAAPMAAAAAAAAPRPAAAASVPARSGAMRLPLLLAAVALVAGAAWLFWPRPAATPGLVAADTPASTPASAAASVLSAAPAASESVPTTAAPAPAAPAATAVPDVAGTAVVVPAVRSGAAAATEPRVAAPAATASPRPTPGRASPAPVVSSPPSQPADEAAKVALAARTGASAVTASAPAGNPAPARLVGPKEICGPKDMLSLWACIDRQCRKAEVRSHPDCVEWRAEQQRRANPTQ